MIDMIGWVAALLTFSTFWAQEMMTLRVLAIFSNVAFITYGGLDSLWPIFGLHCALLPVNIRRLWQVRYQ